MKIINKISIVVCFIFAIIILMSIASQRYVVTPSFEQIEKWFIRNEIEWISDLLNRESERINALCKDWAFWTETYEYVSTLDDDYVLTNLSEQTMSLNFLNFAAIIAPDGRIVISRSCDIAGEAQFIDPIFEDFEGEFITSPNPLLIFDAEQSLHGIAKSKLGPAFIAAYPILKTDKSGSPAGTLVMARVFDSDFFGETFSKGGHSVRITEEIMANCGTNVYDGAYITNYSDGAYSVCKEIKTVYGDADYVLQLITPNFVGEHNRKHSIIIVVIILLIGLSSLLLVLTVVIRIVIIPVSRLEFRIKKMTDNKSLEFVEVGKGKDEIAMLAEQFNDMVAKIKEEEKTKNEISEQLKETNHELQQFAYSVSHDLKEPLRVINSYLQLIEHTDELSEQTREYMQYVMSSAKRMYALIGELLEYSRTNSEQYPLKKCNTAEIVSETIKELEFAVSETKAEIITKDLPLITGYQPLLKQIFRNLIINSLKYCKQGLPPKIAVGCVEEQDEFVFYVEDNGKGIEREYLSKVFELFERLEADEKGGTGLGLAICKKAAERHGGRIWAESEYGKGATFYFTVDKDLAKQPEQLG